MQQQQIPPAMELEQLRNMERIGVTMMQGLEIREQLQKTMDEQSKLVLDVLARNTITVLDDSIDVFMKSWATTSQAHAALFKFENEQQRANIERDLQQVRARIQELETGIVIARGTIPNVGHLFPPLGKSNKGGN